MGTVVALTPAGERTLAAVTADDRATLDFLSNGRRDPVGSDGLIEAGDGDLQYFRAG